MKMHGLRKYSEKCFGNKTYGSWANMKRRCNSDRPKDFKSYKGKGISYPKEWKDFECFVRDMGRRPIGMTLDRIDNDLSYSKSNCRWASYSKQNTNRKAMSNTGEKHISYSHREDRYQVSVHPFRSKKTKILEQAKLLREELLAYKNFINFKGDTMLFDTITYTKRKNEGNYNHSELTVTAALEEGENVLDAIGNLKAVVMAALYPGDQTSPGTSSETTREVTDVISGAKATINLTPEAASASAKKSAPRKKREVDVMDGQAIPPVITTEAASAATPSDTRGTSNVVGTVDTKNVSHVQSEVSTPKASVAKGTVIYDSTVKEHRSRFATFLGQNYPTWKTSNTPEAIKAFSLGLQGKPFEDNKGEMLESFKSELKSFFGK